MSRLNRIRELTLEIKMLEDLLKQEKELVLGDFRSMSSEDKVLCENKLIEEGISITYYPKSTSKKVDTTKLKKDGLYDQYCTEVSKTDCIKVDVMKDNG